MKRTLNEVAGASLASGSTAAVASTVALAALGRYETGRATAPINAVSHWLWGRKAFANGRPALKYTLPGYLIHHAASIFWAAAYEVGFGQRARLNPAHALAGAATVAAVAAFVDFKLTPQRLTPGFEHRLSTKALIGVYAAFAIGLAATAIVRKRR